MNKKFRALIAIFTLFILSGNRVYGAYPEEACFDSYRQGEYEASVDCINSLLYSEKISDTTRLVSCYEYLGVCLTMQDKKVPARAAFNKLLNLRSDFELNPNVYLPEIISLFQISKFEKRTSLKILIVDTLPAYSTAYNFAPLAVPQFLNKQKTKGIIFGSVQVAALVAAVYAFNREQSYFSETYGFREEDVASAQKFDSIHKISLLTLVLAYVAGLVDGFGNKSPVIKN